MGIQLIILIYYIFTCIKIEIDLYTFEI